MIGRRRRLPCLTQQVTLTEPIRAPLGMGGTPSRRGKIRTQLVAGAKCWLASHREQVLPEESCLALGRVRIPWAPCYVAEPVMVSSGWRHSSRLDMRHVFAETASPHPRLSQLLANSRVSLAGHPRPRSPLGRQQPPVSQAWLSALHSGRRHAFSL